jgi:hypothetical protein
MKRWILAGALVMTTLLASNQALAAATGIAEIPDPELELMRGRYTIAGHTVAWFGVTMLSQWQTASGQKVDGGLQVGFDFNQGATPQMTFTPTVSIGTDTGDGLPTGNTQRSIASAGVGNVSGLVQSIQLAGDGNAVSNRTLLVLRDGKAPAIAGSEVAGGVEQASNGPASARVSIDGQRAAVLLTIAGQGAVAQWIGAGQIGQSIALTSDGARVSNQLQLDLVRGAVAANLPLAQTVAQAIGTTQGLGSGRP